MKLTDLLEQSLMIPDLKGQNKKDVLKEFASLLYDQKKIRDRDEFLEVILGRETLSSTGIGEGIAIPHGRLKDLDRLILAFGLSLKGIDFDAMDGKPVHLFFVLTAPDAAPVDHLKTLARISKILKNRSFRKRLLKARTREELYDLIRAEDEKYGP
ncbi:MAG: PTS fructose transporter subunit IIA [Nitrospirae bacterium CG_4_9_14_3_um_filter_53_35]|nr:MAG: PTS fructose transporter subunit IIA [Nitrospirae bacterium CG2_30_53_67]PIS36472.1 MAG: PTS fructose transporter subunit IIA [Nitrospirae bacterium CG08_land_8_20_14_0_20_52_24]PIV82680.1 MAG: PTS fructose transporter subunit IIA [Nitrospirae bacterium CG17_big_fil_post_rev_8_21_14_2_50_50_9]PIW84434.1 MAG: PTS fructose transporter subunit IIA [Nitrospirae bacterium CG_4_8_14_3_um_filter_50_41]PIX84676.1 MAG: PTS fructose transporter subunit IIA [Nitrospirae bacterium CG_4_10_14_3_um_f